MKIRPLSLLDPSRIVRAVRYSRRQRGYDRSAYDLELYLYSKILSNDMLHYGYFDDPAVEAADISISAMEAAQRRYAELITDALNRSGAEGMVLDAGCGMGGLAGMLISSGLEVEALTPNDHQAEYVGQNYPSIRVHHCKYEELDTGTKFGAIVHAESLQYISLEAAFSVSERILQKGGRWFIADYFRLQEDAVNRSGHLLEAFHRTLKDRGWQIKQETDMTPHILPTLKLIRLYADRFLLPLKHFGLEKFRFKKPFWYALTDRIRAGIDEKVDKELAAIDPELFAREKRYLFFELVKSTHL